MNSCIPRCTNNWNNLPEECKSSESVNISKHRLMLPGKKSLLVSESVYAICVVGGYFYSTKLEKVYDIVAQFDSLSS